MSRSALVLTAKKEKITKAKDEEKALIKLAKEKTKGKPVQVATATVRANDIKVPSNVGKKADKAKKQ